MLDDPVLKDLRELEKCESIKNVHCLSRSREVLMKTNRPQFTLKHRRVLLIYAVITYCHYVEVTVFTVNRFRREVPAIDLWILQPVLLEYSCMYIRLQLCVQLQVPDHDTGGGRLVRVSWTLGYHIFTEIF